MEALFSFVCLDPATQLPTPLVQLQLQSAGADEEALFAERQRVADERRAARKVARAEGMEDAGAFRHLGTWLGGWRAAGCWLVTVWPFYIM